MSEAEEMLAVFARAPELGGVKTRLCPPLTPEQALRLHRALVEDTLERLADLKRPSISRILLLSKPLAYPNDLDIPRGFDVGLQSPGDLGEKLSILFTAGFQQGARRIVVLGSDSPTLPLPLVHEAFDLLGRAEVVLGPATDGGYYLLGSSRFHPQIFRGISWGTGEVLQQTRKILDRLESRYELLVPWYDLDRVEDLETLRQEIGYLQRSRPHLVPRRVAEVIADLGEPEYSLGPEFE